MLEELERLLSEGHDPALAAAVRSVGPVLLDAAYAIQEYHRASDDEAIIAALHRIHKVGEVLETLQLRPSL